MAPVNKKRKTTTSFEPTPRIAVVVPARKEDITAFARVSKSYSSKLSKGDENVLRELSSATGRKNANSLKRKPEDDLRTPAKTSVNDGRKENAVTTAHEIRSTTPEAPSLSHAQSQVQASAAAKAPDTPTRGTRSRLEAFSLNASSSTSPCKVQLSVSQLFPSGSSPTAPTPCPKKKRQREEDLPEEVQDLIDLHSSFLSVLSLHYTHNGTATPVDLKLLTPGIGKSFSRRSPTTEDFRRVLALQQRSAAAPEQAALLSIWDYGRGRICIEYCEPAEARTCAKRRQPLETQALTRAFAVFLKEQYRISVNEGASTEDFVGNLPLARLHRRATSKANKSTILSKGQTRLTELKQGAIRAQKRNEPTAETTSQKQDSAAAVPTSKVSSLKPSQRSDSLLSRIRAKESMLASQPAGPNQAQLERRAALQRIPDVINILGQLANNSSSTSTMPITSSPTSSSPTHSSPRISDDDLATMLRRSSAAVTPSPHRGMQAMFGSALTRNVSMSLQQVIGRVRESMRTPMGAPEVERAVRLLAGEVCPEWVLIREIGSVRGVTIRGSSPASGWRERVAAMTAAC